MIDILAVLINFVGIIVAFGAAYLAYRLTRIAGGFRAWWLVIVALVLYCVRMVYDPLAELGAIPSIDWLENSIRLGVGLFLFAAMYDLVGTFGRSLAIEKTRLSLRKWLGAITVPAFIVVLATLIVAERYTPLPTYFDPLLSLVLVLLFVSVISFVTAYVSLRGYLMSGSLTFLFLGCGVLAFGVANLVCLWLYGPPGGPNAVVTVQNTGVLLASVFQFASAAQASGGVRMQVARVRKPTAILAYLGVLVFVALVTVGSLQGVFPTFFAEGVGATPLRQVVLGSALTLFAVSSILFMRLYSRSESEWLYWYSLALALVAVSVLAFFPITSVASSVTWTGKIAQYFAGIYFLIAVLATRGTRKNGADS